MDRKTERTMRVCSGDQNVKTESMESEWSGLKKKLMRKG